MFSVERVNNHVMPAGADIQCLQKLKDATRVQRTNEMRHAKKKDGQAILFRSGCQIADQLPNEAI